MSRVGNTVGSNKSRKDMRAVITLVARYRSPTTFEYANEVCFDISVGGMFIKSAAPAPAGTLLKLECETDNNPDAKIRGVARVVWLRREANEHGPSGMGVKFVKLEAGSRELIESIVQRLADAGVEARSVSAAPEQQLAAAEAARHSTAKVQLVPSSPPAASPAVGAADVKPAVAVPAEAVARAQLQSELSTAQPTAAAAPHSEPPPAAEPQPVAGRDPVADTPPAAEPESDSSRPSARPTGSSRPPAPKPSRFGVKHWIIAIVLVLVAVAIADRRGFGPDETEVTPEPAARTTPPAIAPAPSAPVAAPVREAPAPAPTAQPAAVAEADPKPAAPVAAGPGSAAASAEGPMFPVEPGAKDYLIEFVSRPNAAEVTIDERITLTTPYDLHVGAMPEKIKVTAKKDGYKSSSIWLPRAGFEPKDGKWVKQVYLTLKPEDEAKAK